MTETLIERHPESLAVERPRLEVMKEQYQLVRAVRESVMTQDVHYGASFPGDKKLNLLKPGADALGVAFQFTTEFDIVDKDLGGGHREYRTTCYVKTRRGTLISTGVGTCSTMESKYRWRNDKRKCPACGSAALIKTNKGRNPGGYWCVPDKGGCNANFNPGDPAVEGQITGKIENTDPADQWNTCLKISKKRAYVDGIITATGASDMFTQDAEDFRTDSPPPASDTGNASVTPLPADPAAPKSNVLDLCGRIQRATNKDDLARVWAEVVKESTQLTTAEASQLAKCRRDVEASFHGGK